jgi:hypothetical protein
VGCADDRWLRPAGGHPSVGDGVEQLSTAYEVVSAHHGNNYLLLEMFYKSHRSALFTLLDTLEMEASGDHSVLACGPSAAMRTATGLSAVYHRDIEVISHPGIGDPRILPIRRRRRP